MKFYNFISSQIFAFTFVRSTPICVTETIKKYTFKFSSNLNSYLHYFIPEGVPTHPRGCIYGCSICWTHLWDCRVQLSLQTTTSYDAIIIKTLPPQTMVISPLPFSNPLPFLCFSLILSHSCHSDFRQIKKSSDRVDEGCYCQFIMEVLTPPTHFPLVNGCVFIALLGLTL